MKSLIILISLLISTTILANENPFGSFSCSFSNGYVAHAYEGFDQKGTVVLLQKGKLIESFQVDFSGNGDTYAYVSGTNIYLSLDAESSGEGHLEVTLKNGVQLDKYSDKECSEL